jgi:hypothetical protein
VVPKCIFNDHENKNIPTTGQQKPAKLQNPNSAKTNLIIPINNKFKAFEFKLV